MDDSEMEHVAEDFRVDFRENLKSFRLQKGLTQSELANRAGCDATYIGKLEKGDSSPSFDTLITVGEALEIYPLKLLRPSRAHLDIREEIPEDEREQLPYNPLDIQIFDSLPFVMGIVTDQGTPVYVNDAFVDNTDVNRDDIEENQLWELPFWSFDGVGPDRIKEALKQDRFDVNHLHFEIGVQSPETKTVDFFLYPTPVNYEPGDRMMWIFEFRHPDHDPIDFPLEITSLHLIE